MTFPRCDHCDRTIWCTEVYADGYVFCSPECRDAVQVVDHVARTETDAPPVILGTFPAPATASHETRGPCVASVPPSSSARRPNNDGRANDRPAVHRADLSRLVSTIAPSTDRSA